MHEKDAELLLYRGYCQADGIGEGIFSSVPTNRYYREKYYTAIKTVQKYISDAYRGWAIHISRMDGVTRSEEDALDLINVVESKIKGSIGIIEPVLSNHGRLVFDRKIRFEGWSPQRRIELIDLLKEASLQKGKDISDKAWEYNLSFGEIECFQDI